jgi:hypothetical protein
MSVKGIGREDGTNGSARCTFASRFKENRRRGRANVWLRLRHVTKVNF